MLRDKTDEFYDARLVADARLHLTVVMSGQQCPAFFETMAQIVKRKIHYGYTTVRGKTVKLSGIKDFLHNFHYGLGIKSLPIFVGNCVQIEIEDRSKDKWARRFIDWLQKEDPEAFEFPPEYWEFRRVRLSIARMRAAPEKKKYYWIALRTIYINKPEVVRYIGVNRKYRSVMDAYYEEGFAEKKKVLSPIKLYRCPTYKQVEELARELYSRLDKLKVRVLIAKLIEVYQINEAVEKHLARSAEGGGSDNDDDGDWD